MGILHSICPKWLSPYSGFLHNLSLESNDNWLIDCRTMSKSELVVQLAGGVVVHQLV